MDPLHFFIAVAPLSAYLLLVGCLNVRSKPFVTTGARDAAALGIGLSGLAIAGPMELFLPEAANHWFPGGVWILLILLYLLCLSLTVLLLRPRLVLYNARFDEVRPRIASLASQLDKDARWAGDCVTLPNLKIQLSLESQPLLRTIQLVSAGPHQDHLAWKQLEQTIQEDLKGLKGRGLSIGYPFIAVSLALATGTAAWVLLSRDTVLTSLTEMLRL